MGWRSTSWYFVYWTFVSVTSFGLYTSPCVYSIVLTGFMTRHRAIHWTWWPVSIVRWLHVICTLSSIWWYSFVTISFQWVLYSIRWSIIHVTRWWPILSIHWTRRSHAVAWHATIVSCILSIHIIRWSHTVTRHTTIVSCHLIIRWSHVILCSHWRSTCLCSLIWFTWAKILLSILFVHRAFRPHATTSLSYSIHRTWWPHAITQHFTRWWPVLSIHRTWRSHTILMLSYLPFR